jgi:hypothetical protein
VWIHQAETFDNTTVQRDLAIIQAKVYQSQQGS